MHGNRGRFSLGSSWGEGRGSTGFGALANKTIGGASWFLAKAFLKENAWNKDDDGSFLNEGQLRRLWKNFAVPRFCGRVALDGGPCNGCCCALLDDTVFWSRFDGSSTGYKPATQQELEERGWLKMGPGGLLVAQSRLTREEPSQLEEDDNSKDEGKEDHDNKDVDK